MYVAGPSTAGGFGPATFQLSTRPAMYTQYEDARRKGWRVGAPAMRGTVTGGPGNDVIIANNIAGSPAKTLNGNNGQDYIASNGGSDILDGGEGKDVMTVNGAIGAKMFGDQSQDTFQVFTSTNTYI